MTRRVEPADYEKTIERIKVVRAQAIEHTRQARALADERRDLVQSLIGKGVSRAQIGAELGVSRQVIRKWLDL